MSSTLAQGLNSKHLAAGSQCPPLAGKLRVYNMKYCPFAERVLVALEHKGIPYEVVNINLSEKPEWYLKDKNPLGAVPAVETADGKQVAFDSLICVEWLDALYPEKKIFSADPYERAKGRMLLERLADDIISGYYGALRDAQNQEKLTHLEHVLTFAESLLTDKYYGGSKPGFVDYMLWGWFERLEVVELVSQGKFKVTAEKFPKIAKYIETMKTDPAVQKVMRPAAEHAKFYATAGSGKPDYDVMLH